MRRPHRTHPRRSADRVHRSTRDTDGRHESDGGCNDEPAAGSSELRAGSLSDPRQGESADDLTLASGVGADDALPPTTETLWWAASGASWAQSSDAAW